MVGVGSAIIGVESYAVGAAVGKRIVVVYNGVAHIVGAGAVVDITPAVGKVVFGTGSGGKAWMAVEVFGKR